VRTIGGLTLTPGSILSPPLLGGDGGCTYPHFAGLNNAAIVFEIGTSLTTGSGSSVIIENPGSDDEVIWDVGTSATLGTTTAFEGKYPRCYQHHSEHRCNHRLRQRPLALNGAVTLDGNTITTGCNGLSESPRQPAPLQNLESMHPPRTRG